MIYYFEDDSQKIKDSGPLKLDGVLGNSINIESDVDPII